MALKDELKDFAREIGIAALGVTGSEPMIDGLHIYHERIKKAYLTNGRKPRLGFEPEDLNKRTDPQASMPGVKSIIVIAVPYKVPFGQKTVPEYYGNLARIGWGCDYHLVVASKLRKIEQFLRDAYKHLHAQAIVDTGFLLERSFAVRAGIGWIGKNNTLIVPGVGSYVNLGELLIDRVIEPDEPLDKGCGECVKCIKACPTNALVDPWMLNVRICLSYLTQVPEIKPDWAISLFEGKLYGCDNCQEVCPHNIKAPEVGDINFYPSKLLPKPDLLEILEMGVREYVDVVGETAVEWMGRDVFQKNAIIALTRFQDQNNEVRKIIARLSNDQRPVIRSAVAWANKLLESR